MRRIEPYDLEKVTLNLRKGDKERLSALHGRLGYGKVIRELVIKHIATVETVTNTRTGDLDLDIPKDVLPI